jgi:hypothetical protein
MDTPPKDILIISDRKFLSQTEKTQQNKQWNFALILRTNNCNLKKLCKELPSCV